MRVHPEHRREGYTTDRLIRTCGERCTPGYREDRLEPVVFQYEVLKLLSSRYDIYPSQSYWFEGKYVNEDEAIRDAWGCPED